MVTPLFTVAGNDGFILQRAQYSAEGANTFSNERGITPATV